MLAKFTIRLKSQSEQYKAITLRNVIDGESSAYLKSKGVSFIKTSRSLRKTLNKYGPPHFLVWSP